MASPASPASRERASHEGPAEDPPAQAVAWHALDIEAAEARLETDRARGLSEAEASRRLEIHGPNRLAEVRGPSPVAILVRQFASAFILILVVAAAISAALGETLDAIAITAILLVNGLLGFAQEWKAERAVEALRRMLQPRCTVMRGGRGRELPVADLVPGDVVGLSVGDRVPADVRLVETSGLRADESSLTGESDSVAKGYLPAPAEAPPAERPCMAWMGTTISEGCALGIVVGTGMRTEFGRIAELTRTVSSGPTPLGRELNALARQLGIVSVIIAVLVGGLGLALGRPALEMFLTAVSLAVAVVPEGLPAVITITLALGIRRMAARRALLRRLQAAETLGAATVICTDKTGTLTENEMTVRRVWLPAGPLDVSGSGYDPAGHYEREGERIEPATRPDLMALLGTAVRCNRARVAREGGRWTRLGEPTEAALVVAGYKAGVARDEEATAVTEFPFNSERKRMTVVDRHDGRGTAHVKGAPEVILERCTRVLEGEDERPLRDEERVAAVAAYEAMAEDGLRTLALARRELAGAGPEEPDAVERDLTLLGIVGILDPPRPEVPAAVGMARAAGISVIMITGDAPATALAIATRVGLRADRPITGSELDDMGDDALLEALAGDAVFARTMPEQKLRIVELLQGAGQVVAMTGDGVNDAPALKKADVGVSMGIRGTDVAREASDIVIADDNFASIVGAVEEGRRQYDNIRKFVHYLLSSNVGEVTAILANLVVGGPLILLPVQILWMNLVTDGVTALALGVEPAEEGLMRRAPRDPEARVLSGRSLVAVLLIGLYIGGATLWLFQHYRSHHGPGGLLVAQTVAFTGIIVLEKMNVFNFRSLEAPLRARRFFANGWLLAAWASMIALQAAAVYVPFLQRALHTVPLSAADWLHAAAVALPVVLFPEAFKRLAGRRAGAPGDPAPAAG